MISRNLIAINQQDSTLAVPPEDDAKFRLEKENVLKESMQELEEKQTSSNATSQPTTSRRRTHSESGTCRFVMQSFQCHDCFEQTSTSCCRNGLERC